MFAKRLLGLFTWMMVLSIPLGCGKTVLRDVWVEPDRSTQNFSKFLVVMVTPREGARRTIEDAFVASFQDPSISATASYTLDSDPKPIGPERLAALVREGQCHGVLMLQFLGTEKETYYTQGMSHSVPVAAIRTLRGGYVIAYNHVQSPGYLQHNKIVVMDLRLYDAGSDRLLWSAVSRTTNPESTADLAKEMAIHARKNLVEQRIISTGK